jgi:hypothetical protein
LIVVSPILVTLALRKSEVEMIWMPEPVIPPLVPLSMRELWAYVS